MMTIRYRDTPGAGSSRGGWGKAPMLRTSAYFTCFTVLLKFYHSIVELDLLLTISKNCIISIDFKQDIQINWHDVEMSVCPMPGAKRPLTWGKAPTHGCFAPYYFMIWIRIFELWYISMSPYKCRVLWVLFILCIWVNSLPTLYCVLSEGSGRFAPSMRQNAH